jgi:hypothetical protein
MIADPGTAMHGNGFPLVQTRNYRLGEGHRLAR